MVWIRRRRHVMDKNELSRESQDTVNVGQIFCEKGFVIFVCKMHMRKFIKQISHVPAISLLRRNKFYQKSSCGKKNFFNDGKLKIAIMKDYTSEQQVIISLAKLVRKIFTFKVFVIKFAAERKYNKSNTFLFYQHLLSHYFY